MWRVVYVASGEQVAQKIKEMLTLEGFLVTCRASGARRSDSGRALRGPIEILVPEAEVEEAHERITEIVAGGNRI